EEVDAAFTRAITDVYALRIIELIPFKDQCIVEYIPSNKRIIKNIGIATYVHTDAMYDIEGFTNNCWPIRSGCDTQHDVPTLCAPGTHVRKTLNFYAAKNKLYAAPVDVYTLLCIRIYTAM
ncbi:hypothetical protein Tco_1379718, partial [Tanacetum coccineum]